MAHKQCPREFSWCAMHDTTFEDDSLHSKHVGFGIEFDFDETSGKTSVSWQPDWTDWTIEPGEVYQELEPLRLMLESLAYEFRQFGKEVTAVEVTHE